MGSPFGSLTCLTLLVTSSLPGFASAYAAALSSGPPSPSKSRAFVGLDHWSAPKRYAKIYVAATNIKRDRGSNTYCPVARLMSPPSSTGISRLSPAPDAAEPTVTSLPGNFLTADSSIPDSTATLSCQLRIISESNRKGRRYRMCCCRIFGCGHHLASRRWS